MLPENHKGRSMKKETRVIGPFTRIQFKVRSDETLPGDQQFWEIEKVE